MSVTDSTGLFTIASALMLVAAWLSTGEVPGCGTGVPAMEPTNSNQRTEEGI